MLLNVSLYLLLQTMNYFKVLTDAVFNIDALMRPLPAPQDQGNIPDPGNDPLWIEIGK